MLGLPPAIEPSAPTATGPASGAVALSKNCLPSVLVARRPAAALVEEYRPVGHRGVELGERRQAQLGEHPRRAGAHRGDELARRHVLPSRGEHRQDFGEVDRELPLRDVVAGAVGQADEVAQSAMGVPQ